MSDKPTPGLARVVIAVPGEGPAERIADALRDQSRFEVVARVNGHQEAVETIAALRPDAAVLWLGPELDGFTVIRGGAEALPVIYVAADGAHAARAFEVRAVDYLVEPVERERLREAIERLQHRLAGRPRPELGRGPDGATDGDREDGMLKDRYLAVKQDRAYRLIDVLALRWAEAARNYVRLHTDEGEFLCRMALSELESRLDPRHYVRIHRSSLVNARRIRRIVPLKWGDCEVELDSGEALKMSRTYRSNLLQHR